MGYRQQLRKDRAALAVVEDVKTPRRRVRAGETFHAKAGEQLDVVTEIEGSDVVLACVTAGEGGHYTVGTGYRLSS